MSGLVRAEIGGETLEADPKSVPPEVAARIEAMVTYTPEDQLRPAMHVLWLALLQAVAHQSDTHSDHTDFGIPVSLVECSVEEHQMGREVAELVASRCGGDYADALRRVATALVHSSRKLARIANRAAILAISEWERKGLASKSHRVH